MVVLRDRLALFQWREALEKKGTELAFVPTMGFLHAGHQSLIKKAKEDGGACLVSIFVNPLQFAPGEDLDAYPRDEDGDLRKIQAINPEAVVFMPTVEDLYPTGFQTRVIVTGVTQGLCAQSRPDHFEGVTTVVARFFGLVRPHRAYFGQKDYQQLIAIQTMVRDLAMPIAVIGVPIVRASDGLALSSRNVYLSPRQREEALVLSQSLARVERAYNEGLREPESLLYLVKSHLMKKPGIRIDYVAIRDAETLGPAQPDGPMVVALAAFVGDTRLIDNRVLSS